MQWLVLSSLQEFLAHLALFEGHFSSKMKTKLKLGRSCFFRIMWTLCLTSRDFTDLNDNHNFGNYSQVDLPT